MLSPAVVAAGGANPLIEYPDDEEALCDFMEVRYFYLFVLLRANFTLLGFLNSRYRIIKT